LNAGRELSQRFGDRGLHILRGRIDLPRQRKLERDVGAAQGARRRHRVDPGDRRELFLERRRDCRGHRLRARTGQARGNGNRGEVDVGEIAHGQQAIRHQPEHENSEHHERCGDGTADEQSRNVHFGFPVSAVPTLPPAPPAVSVVGPPRMSTLEFGVSRSWPSVTTSVPAGTPAITLRLSSVRSTVMGWVVAVPSLLTTKTYVPCWPCMTA